MLVSDIITEVRQIVQEMDPLNTHASDSVILGWINACTLQLCSSMSTLPKVTLSTVVAANTISLPTNLIRMDYASISDGNTPPQYSPLKTIDFVNFARISKDWQSQTTDKPSTLVRMTDLDWMMFPNPSAAWVGKALTLIGSTLPTPLTGFSDTPAVSITLHPAYVHYCAWKFFLLVNAPERASASFAAYDGLRKLNLGTATSTTGSLLSFKMQGM